MIKTARLFILTVLTLSASCTVGPDYKKPEINAPPNFVLQDILDSLNQSKSDKEFSASWWKGFSDLILDELVLIGLEKNFQVAAARSRLNEASARVALAGSRTRLQSGADLDGDLEEERELNEGESTETASITGSVDLALPLDVAGRFARGVEAARAGEESARAELRGLVLGVSSSITSEYLRLRGTQRQLDLLKESVQLQEKTLTIVKNRYEAGLSPELDVRRAETSVETLRAGIPRLIESLTNSRNRLAALTGEYPGAYESLLKEHHDIPVYQGRVPRLVPLDVLTRRPDIRQNEEELKQAVARIGVAEAEYYPNFQLIGGLSIGASGISGAPALNIITASLGTLIQQVLTTGGARKAGVDIALAQAEAALADYQQSLREASEEVESSLAAIKSSLGRQTALQKAVQSSQISFYQAETLYQQGLISFLNVVDAQRVLANAEQALAAERTNYATQIATLFRVLGTEVEIGS